MGLFSTPAKVYKPAAEVDLGPDSGEHYISPNVKGPSPCPVLIARSCRLAINRALACMIQFRLQTSESSASRTQ